VGCIAIGGESPGRLYSARWGWYKCPMPEPGAPPSGQTRDFVVLSTAQFFLAFALNFMFVFLPFFALLFRIGSKCR